MFSQCYVINQNGQVIKLCIFCDMWIVIFVVIIWFIVLCFFFIDSCEGEWVGWVLLRKKYRFINIYYFYDMICFVFQVIIMRFNKLKLINLNIYILVILDKFGQNYDLDLVKLKEKIC